MHDNRHDCSIRTFDFQIALTDPGIGSNSTFGLEERTFSFVNNFPLSIERARQARDDGLFIYLGFRLAYDGFADTGIIGQIHGTLDEVFIAGSEPSTPIFCSGRHPVRFSSRTRTVSNANSCVVGLEAATEVGSEAETEATTQTFLPSEHSARHWVQISTGADPVAFRFDLPRIQRMAGGLLDDYQGFTAQWGQSNRLLVGPFESVRAANRMVHRLGEVNIPAFRFTSADGEQIDPLSR